MTSVPTSSCGPWPPCCTPCPVRWASCRGATTIRPSSSEPGWRTGYSPCHLRAAVGHALAGTTVAGCLFAFDRPGQPTARLLPSSFCHPLGLGIYRIVLPCQVMIVFASTLGAAAVGEAASAAKPELAGMGTGGLDIGVLSDELTAVNLVSLRQPRNDREDTGPLLLDAALVLAGACTHRGGVGVRCDARHQPNRRRPTP